MTEGNVIDLFNSLDYKNEKNKALFIGTTFEGREKISVEELLEKLDLEQSARRESISVREKTQVQVPSEVNQSQFIKSQIKGRLSTNKEEDFFKGKASSDGNDYIPIEDIPEHMRGYFNYGSELEPIFANVAE